MAKFTRILSIDGGGIRGIIAGQIVVAIEEKLKKKTGNPDAKIADYFDLIAGTSAGGILACLYLTPDPNNPTRPKSTAQEAVNFYIKRGNDIFSLPWLKRLTSLNGWISDKYPSEPLEKLLLSYFGDLKLSQLLKPCLVSAYDIERRKAHFFTQHDAVETAKADFLVRDVARATSAAPTYFAPAKIASRNQENYALVDGGVFANNPALCAYAEARHKSKIFNYPQEKGPIAKEMVILSLGTGDMKKPYPYPEARNWGTFLWLRPLFDIIMTGVAETVDYQMRQIFDASDRPNQYLRITLELGKYQALPIDDASPDNVSALVNIGNDLAASYSQELDRFIDLLLTE